MKNKFTKAQIAAAMISVHEKTSEGWDRCLLATGCKICGDMEDKHAYYAWRAARTPLPDDECDGGNRCGEQGCRNCDDTNTNEDSE